MAGRGRGRGGASFTFDIQAIGFSRGESLPDAQLQPLPLFPSTDYKPVPTKTGEDQDYMIALKQELRKTMRKLPYYVGKEAEKLRIERYSTKYEIEAEKKLLLQWTPDWEILPREMKTVKKAIKKVVPKKAKVAKSSSNVDVMKKLEDLEKKGDEEKSDEENEGKAKEEGEEEEEAEALIEDEEEHEDVMHSSLFVFKETNLTPFVKCKALKTALAVTWLMQID
ncbi:hypothetical protein FKM82_000424 [Ascaphus truei]